MDKVVKGPKCWEWTGTRSNGYGRFTAKVGNRHKECTATRWIWEYRRGPIPKGKILMHRCDNPPCVRLAHLKLGTKRENLLDCIAKGLYRGRGPAREYL